MGGSTFSVRLLDDLKREVDQLAKVTKRSRAFVVKEAVAAFIEEQRAYLAAIDEALEKAEHRAFVSGEQL
jgi:predicted transcriptional regulator